MEGLDALKVDAQLHPPDAKAGEASGGQGGKGRSKNGAEGLRQAVLQKQRHENGADEREDRLRDRQATQEQATAGDAERQRDAALANTGAKPACEDCTTDSDGMVCGLEGTAPGATRRLRLRALVRPARARQRPQVLGAGQAWTTSPGPSGSGPSFKGPQVGCGCFPNPLPMGARGHPWCGGVGVQGLQLSGLHLEG